ncbi:MAG: hypothetical protein Q9170_002190 [Blastenia crenularia]
MDVGNSHKELAVILLISFTSFNEKERMAERYVRFNVPELMHIAAMAVGRDKCIDIMKVTEGGFNKVFLLTMNDGYEVIARIPTPIAGPAHYTTASEVATMDFLRTRLDIPAPKVFAWASRVDGDNPVGAEYIIMEKMQGESLASRWSSLSTKELAEVIEQIVDIESRLFSARFSEHGSLYYKADLEEEVRENNSNEQNGVNLLSDQFGIGPIANRSFWTEERGQMTLDRGPCLFPCIFTQYCTDRSVTGIRSEDYLTSIGKREAAWTIKLGQPRQRQFFFSFSEQNIEPKDHISLLSQYVLVSPYLIPRQGDLALPTLRHPDLHQSNIFLRPQSTDILGIIDWQGASILPCFLQAGFPFFCDHDPGRLQTLEKPKLSDNFENMNPGEQEEALMNLKHKQANLYYTAATGLKCERHMRALRLPYLEMRQYLIKQAGMPWDGDLVNLRAALIGVYSKWDDLVGERACPISFTDEEVRFAMQESGEWNEAAEVLTTIRDTLGIDGEGGTNPENYNRAAALNKEWRIQMLKEAKAEEKERSWQIWPLKDDDDDSEAPAVINT